MGWRSAPTVCWPAPTTTARWSCGMRSPAWQSTPSRPAAPADRVNGVAFSPDGLLASADNHGTIRLLDASLFSHPYEALCDDVGPPTRQDWHQYAPGEAQPKVCA